MCVQLIIKNIVKARLKNGDYKKSHKSIVDMIKRAEKKGKLKNLNKH